MHEGIWDSLPLVLPHLYHATPCNCKLWQVTIAVDYTLSGVDTRISGMYYARIRKSRKGGKVQDAQEMSTREAAALLTCSQQAVRNYWRLGVLKGEKRPRGRVGTAMQLWLTRESVEKLAQKGNDHGLSQ